MTTRAQAYAKWRQATKKNIAKVFGNIPKDAKIVFLDEGEMQREKFVTNREFHMDGNFRSMPIDIDDSEMLDRLWELMEEWTGDSWWYSENRIGHQFINCQELPTLEHIRQYLIRNLRAEGYAVDASKAEEGTYWTIYETGRNG